MNKLRNEIMSLKVHINSFYGVSGISQADKNGRSLYDELLNKKERFFKVQNRVYKVKRIYG